MGLICWLDAVFTRTLTLPTAFLRSKSQYAAAASAAGVPAIIGGGIYPGTSNVMAAHMVSISRKEYDDEWNFLESPGGWVPYG